MARWNFHACNQIKFEGVVRLFKSHRPDFKDGEQLRDFVYVKDVVKVMVWMMKQFEQGYVIGETIDVIGETTDVRRETVDGSRKTGKLHSGLYNLGTGQARSFYDLVNATFAGVNMQPNIQFINMPEDIRDKYQYFTEANISKLRQAGYTAPFYSLEEGVMDYVKNYLAANKVY